MLQDLSVQHKTSPFTWASRPWQTWSKWKKKQQQTSPWFLTRITPQIVLRCTPLHMITPRSTLALFCSLQIPSLMPLDALQVWGLYAWMPLFSCTCWCYFGVACSHPLWIGGAMSTSICLETPTAQKLEKTNKQNPPFPEKIFLLLIASHFPSHSCVMCQWWEYCSTLSVSPARWDDVLSCI